MVEPTGVPRAVGTTQQVEEISHFLLDRLSADEATARMPAGDDETADLRAGRAARADMLRGRHQAVDMCLEALRHPDRLPEIRVFAYRLITTYARAYQDHPDAPRMA